MRYAIAPYELATVTDADGGLRVGVDSMDLGRGTVFEKLEVRRASLSIRTEQAMSLAIRSSRLIESGRTAS